MDFIISLYPTHIHSPTCSFLFKGDGRAVAIPTQTQGTAIYDVPRSSFDTSLPPSYKRHNSIPGYNNHVLTRSKSHDQDSGYPGSPAGSMNMSPQLSGPPVRLDKHPSIRRKRPDLSRSSSTTSFGSYSDRDTPYAPTTQSGDPSLDRDGSGDSSRSNSPQDDDGDVIGQMDPDQPNGNGYYDSVPRRILSDGETSNGQQRIILNGGGGVGSHYEEMIHPRNSMGNFDGYVFMKPAENGSHATSAPIPVAQRNGGPAPSDDTYHHLQRRPSPQNSSSSPRNRSNYDQLPTISEGKRLHPGAGPTNYENHPLPRDLKGVSIDYKPNYQNVEMAKHGRRGSMNQDKYENVDGEQSSPNSNTNNASDQKRRFSLRRRSSEKESVMVENGLTSPMKNGSSDIESYVVIQSEGENGRVNPGMHPVGYYQGSEVIGGMRSQRREQESHYHRPQVVLK